MMDYRARNRETPDRLLNQIIMSHNSLVNSNKLILLVEGKYDVPFYKKFCDTQYVHIYFTDGSDKMNSLMPMLQQRNYEYLSIQDSDFKFLGQQKNNSQNLFFTDYHDYEMTCFADTTFSQAYSDRLKNDYGVVVDYGKIDSDLFLLSCYKAYNMINSLSVSFKGLDQKVAVLQNLGHEEIQKNIVGNLHQACVTGFIRGNQKLVNVKWHLHNGHDWLNRICYQLNSQHNVEETDLQDLLVEIYSKNEFSKTQLYQDIAVWSSKAKKKVWN